MTVQYFFVYNAWELAHSRLGDDYRNAEGGAKIHDRMHTDLIPIPQY